jgi:GT2 family glycosyltransferase
MNNAPEVSVIIATYQRYSLLIGCLQSLKTAQETGRHRFEVIAVDDGGKLPHTIEKEVDGLTVQWLYLEQNLGQPGAQAAGVKAAAADIFAFLDDDAEVDAHWVDAIFDYFQRYPEVGAVLGRIQPVDSSHLLPRMRQQIYEKRHRLYTDPAYIQKLRQEANLPVTTSPGLSNHISGGNYTIRREILEKIGGIDPSIRLGSDDWLSMRLLNAHIPIGYNPQMIIRHHHNRSARVLFSTNIIEGRDRIRILRRGDASRGKLLRAAFGSLIKAPFAIRNFPEMLQADKIKIKVYIVYTLVQFFDALGQVYEAVQK